MLRYLSQVSISHTNFFTELSGHIYVGREQQGKRAAIGGRKYDDIHDACKSPERHGFRKALTIIDAQSLHSHGQ
jgi:hypothetical protein